MEFLSLLESMGLPGNLARTLMEGYDAILESKVNIYHTRMEDTEYRRIVQKAFMDAITHNRISPHVTNFNYRYANIPKFIESHEFALGVLEGLKKGRGHLVSADFYDRFEDGTIKYVAFATCDNQNLAKIVSKGNAFPPKDGMELVVQTVFKMDYEDVKAKWLAEIARETGQEVDLGKLCSSLLKNGGQNIKMKLGQGQQRVDQQGKPRVRAGAKEIIGNINGSIDKKRTEVAPLYRQLNAIAMVPRGQRDLDAARKIIYGIHYLNGEIDKLRDTNTTYKRQAYDFSATRYTNKMSGPRMVKLPALNINDNNALDDCLDKLATLPRLIQKASDAFEDESAALRELLGSKVPESDPRVQEQRAKKANALAERTRLQREYNCCCARLYDRKIQEDEVPEGYSV